MATFFVGQRVRVARIFDPDPGFETSLGQEGFVNEIDCESESGELGQIGVTLAFGPPGRERDEWCFEPAELEPILPDGHRACDDDFKRDLDRLLERQGIAA